LIVEGNVTKFWKVEDSVIHEKQTQRRAEATQAKGDFGTKWSIAEEGGSREQDTTSRKEQQQQHTSMENVVSVEIMSGDMSKKVIS
jgi:hypothetical protein